MKQLPVKLIMKSTAKLNEEVIEELHTKDRDMKEIIDEQRKDTNHNKSSKTDST